MQSMDIIKTWFFAVGFYAREEGEGEVGLKFYGFAKKHQ